MAEIPVSDEEMALRRRARRRLVGAVALALTAIVILPMLFDPEPKPLGSDVDVQIPLQDTPFKPTPNPAASTEAAPPAVAAPEAGASMLNPVETAAPTQAAPPPLLAKPAEPTQAPATPDTLRKASPAREISKEPAPEAAKPVEKKTEPAKGYSLQLGLFSKKANADKVIERAKATGFRAQAAEAHQGRWRVWVGPLSERGKAEAAQAKLKAKGLDAVLVAP